MATPQHHTQHRNLLRPAPDDDTIASSGDGDAGSDGGGPAVEVTSIKSRKPGQWRLMATRSIDMLLLCTSTNMAQLPHVDPQGNECTGCGRRNVERPGSCGHTFGMSCSACHVESKKMMRSLFTSFILLQKTQHALNSLIGARKCLQCPSEQLKRSPIHVVPRAASWANRRLPEF